MACMTVDEYAKRMGVSKKTIRDRCARGYYDNAFKEGRRWYLMVDEEPEKQIDLDVVAELVLQKLLKRLSTGRL